MGIEHSDQSRTGLASQVLGSGGREEGATAGWYRLQPLTLQRCLSLNYIQAAYIFIFVPVAGFHQSSVEPGRGPTKKDSSNTGSVWAGTRDLSIIPHSPDSQHWLQVSWGPWWERPFGVSSD